MSSEDNRGARSNTWSKFITDSVQDPPSCSEVLGFVSMKFKQATEPVVRPAAELFVRVDNQLGRLLNGLDVDTQVERFQAWLENFAAKLARLDALCWDATEDTGDYLSSLFAFVSLDEHTRREILGVITSSAHNNNHGTANEVTNEVRNDTANETANEANNDAATTRAAANPGPSDKAQLAAHADATCRLVVQDTVDKCLRGEEAETQAHIAATSAISAATNPGPSNDAHRAALRNNLFLLSGWSHDADYRRTVLSEDYLEAREALSNIENAENAEDTDSDSASPPAAPSDEDDKDEDDNKEQDKDDKAKAKDENDDVDLAEGTSIEVNLDVTLEADHFAGFSDVVAHPEPANAAFEFDPEEIVAGTRAAPPTPPDAEVGEDVSEDGVGFVLVRSADDDDHNDDEYCHIPSPTSSFDELESNASSSQ